MQQVLPAADFDPALPGGTWLGEFEIERVIGVGGFGIVYLAFDHALERPVAIKEYMPASLAGRTSTLQVSLRSHGDAETFAAGLKSFVNEARMLARFDHPSLLKVHRFWEANGTAYMAMPVLNGKTLKDVRKSMDAPPDEAWLRSLLTPLLGAIERLHGGGVYHRDIAPDNVVLEAAGLPVLLDFGAARRVIGDRSQALTAILKPAYAPIEQYAEAGAVRQGPWTDLYALGATLHYMLLGRPPTPATARAVHDDQQLLAAQPITGCSQTFLQAIDWMLALRPVDRPQSVAALREVLEGRLLPPAPLPSRPPMPVAPLPSAEADWERTAVLEGPAPPRPQPARQPAAGLAPFRVEADGAADHDGGGYGAGIADEPFELTTRLARRPPPPPPTLMPMPPPTPTPTSIPRTDGTALIDALVALPPTQPDRPLPAFAHAASSGPSAPATARRPHRGRVPVAPLVGASLAAAAVALAMLWPNGPTPLTPAAVQTADAASPAAGAVLAGVAAAAVDQTLVPPPDALLSTAATDGTALAAASPFAAAASAAASTAAASPARPTSESRPLAKAQAPSAMRALAAKAGEPLAETAKPADVEAARPAADGPSAAAPVDASASAHPASPGELCSRRVLVAQWLCIERECAKAELAQHAECVRWRSDQANKANPDR